MSSADFRRFLSDSRPWLADAGLETDAIFNHGFDLPAFERVAKMIFIRLQAANDAGDLDDLRQFTTPEMFAATRLDLQERGKAAQQTDVERVDAEVARGQGDEVAHRMLLTGGDHEILSFGLLQHQPLSLDEIAGVAPVATGVQIAEIQTVLLAEMYPG